MHDIAYSPEQFIRLAQEIEETGGVHVDELCSARPYSFTGPNPEGKEVFLPGCGNYSIFEVPYEAESGDLMDRIRLCAVCDALGWTPRFSHVMRRAA